jgi:hypothetical protein
MAEQFDHLYEEADKYLILHDQDPDLPVIKVPVPKPPADKTKIANYGKHPKDQKFFHEKMPKRLQQIVKHVRRYFEIKEDDSVSPDQIYEYLEIKRKDWIEEIKWIKRMIHYRYNGRWFYIKGKPYYINRWYWFYLNQWPVGNDKRVDGLPDFRYRDLLWWSASLYLYETTTAPFNYEVRYVRNGIEQVRYFGSFVDMKKFKNKLHKENESAINRNEMKPYPGLRHKKGYFLIDVGERVNFGIAYPKGRRDGATFRSQCGNYLIVTEGYNRYAGIQSKSDTDSQSVFDNKLIKPWQKLWFFFKPTHDGGTTPKSSLNMQVASQKRNAVVEDLGIQSWMDHRASGNIQYDGEKLHAIHHDEVGKKEKGSNYDVRKRWSVVKKCLAQGQGKEIIGWAWLTSTTQKMKGEGGKEFYEISRLSMYDQRNANGQTISGLVNVFIPASEGLEGFVDEYGFTVLRTPDEPVRGINGKMITKGSLDHILDTRAALEEAEEWEELNDEIRMAPLFWKESFREDNSDSGFNLHKLNQRLQEIRITPPRIRHFDLDWDGTPLESQVRLVDNSFGKFKASWLPDRSRMNTIQFDPIIQAKGPKVDNKLYAGADPFKFNQVKFGRKSNGAGAIYQPFNSRLDNPSSDPSTWVSNKFCITYNNRVEDKDTYAMDMLMMCVMTGAMMFPEVNVPLIDEKFKEWGFAGFLLFFTDAQGRTSPMSGRSTNEKVKQDIFQLWMTYINRFVEYERHIEIIEECMQIPGPKDMKDYDLFTAGGYSLLAADIFESVATEEEMQNTDIREIFGDIT